MARLRTGIVSVLTFLAIVSLPVLAFAVSAASTMTPPAGTKAAATAEQMVTPSAAEPTPTTASALGTASAPTTQTYDLDFTLPTYGKSGCLVCHGDPRLASIGVQTTSTVYVDVEILNASAHNTEDTVCTGCHLDFAYTAQHKQIEGEWEAAARLACKNCHKDSFSAYANGIHSPAGKPGAVASETAAAREAEGKPQYVPLCGDCHGGHAIPSMDDTAAMSALHLSGGDMCGQCHKEASESYADYYHGAAYQNGSADAPSCWDCHGYHEILAVDDRQSPVHESRLAETCGQTGCHDNVDEQFLEYAGLIHGQKDAEQAVAITQATSRIFEAMTEAWQDIVGVF